MISRLTPATLFVVLLTCLSISHTRFNVLTFLWRLTWTIFVSFADCHVGAKSLHCFIRLSAANVTFYDIDTNYGITRLHMVNPDNFGYNYHYWFFDFGDFSTLFLVFWRFINIFSGISEIYGKLSGLLGFINIVNRHQKKILKKLLISITRDHMFTSRVMKCHWSIW